MKGPFFVREWTASDYPAGRKGFQHWSVVSESDDDDFVCDGLDSRVLADDVAAILNAACAPPDYCVSCGAFIKDGMVERSRNHVQCVECAPDENLDEEAAL